MRKVELRNILAVVFVFLVVSLVFAPDQGLAAEVWSDYFNREELGGDWATQQHVAIDDGWLKGTISGGSTYHPSNVSIGTWSFDVLDVGIEFPPNIMSVFVYFMCLDPGDPSESCYSMEISKTSKAQGHKYVYYLTKDQTRLASYDGMEGDDLTGTLHQMAISRTDTGVMRVFLNGSRIIQWTDTDMTTSECFKVIFGYDFRVDNLVVENTPILGENILEDGWVVIVIVGAGVIIIAVVVFLRRR